MTRNNNLKRLSLITGAALAMSVSAAPSFAASSDSNPFGMTELSQGFQLAGTEGKCGASKCGGNKSSEAKCGEGKAKASESKCGEGKCGGSKAKSSEGKCGGSKAKSSESKCGEGKCGGMN
jgi:uncharacterized low-complexity protein